MANTLPFPGRHGVNDAGHLTIGGCDALELAATFGTPLYVFDEQLIRDNLRAYRAAIPGSLYAAKAFLTVAMAQLVASEGVGLDVVSGGELATALRAGFPAERIVMHGNNKSPAELAEAVSAGVGRIVVDSHRELLMLDEIARSMQRHPAIHLRITPGIKPDTHTYIQTGQLDSKFGTPIADGQAQQLIIDALNCSSIRLSGLHCHIGSQLFDLAGLEAAMRLMVDLMAETRAATGAALPELNIGGGLGIRYRNQDTPPDIATYAAHLIETITARCAVHDLPVPRLLCEPGRSIVGEAGVTLYTVGTIKDVPGIRTYLAVDGGMTDNPRPALYEAVYEATVASRPAAPATKIVTVAGKCCESGDILIRDVALPEPQPGDILAVFATGAYNYAMASHYNRLPKPAVVFCKDGEAHLIVERETYADLYAKDLPLPRAASVTL
ncbi:MAG: diaminopimelate decarboxylase [Candidatus Sericytochromatia bacterium]|nr:diaminopimelate decarboxylase [Candidatus Sericytochromatia bacterium]